MEGQGEIDINQSVSNNATDVQGYIDVDVSSEEEDVVCSQPVVPFMGMEFDSVEEARRVYNAYAFKMGFNIRVASSRNSTVTKKLIRKEFECTHARRPDSEQEDNTSTSTATNDVSKVKASKRKSSTKDVAQAKASKKKSSSTVLTTASKKCSTVKKYDCKAHMAVGLWDGKWRVVVMKVEHTHPLVKQIGRRKQLRSHRRISFTNYKLMKTLHHRNISTMQIMAVLSDFHGGIGNLLYNSKDVSNLRSHLRKGVHLRDMKATLEYF